MEWTFCCTFDLKRPWKAQQSSGVGLARLSSLALQKEGQDIFPCAIAGVQLAVSSNEGLISTSFLRRGHWLLGENSTQCIENNPTSEVYLSAKEMNWSQRGHLAKWNEKIWKWKREKDKLKCLEMKSDLELLLHKGLSINFECFIIKQERQL